MYLVDFAYVKPSLNPKNKSYFIIVCKSFNVLLNLVYKYFVKFLKSMLIMDIACNFPFLVKSLSDFGSGYSGLENQFESFPSSSNFWGIEKWKLKC